MEIRHADLEKLRQQMSLPEGGKWDSTLNEGRWMYHYAIGPSSFTVIADVCQLSGLVSPH